MSSRTVGQRARWRFSKIPAFGWIAGVGLLWIPLLLGFPVLELLSHSPGLKSDLLSALQEMAGAIRVSSYYGIASTLVAVFVSIPLAIVIAGGSRTQRSFYATLMLAPLFVNLVLRVYALRYLSLNDRPLAWIAEWFDFTKPLIGTDFLVIVGLAYTYLPFAAIPLAVSLEGIPVDQIEAGANLGLRKIHLMRIVGFRHFGRGVIAAVILTFVPTFGDLLVFRALGGSKKLVVAQYLYIEAIDGNSPETAALGVSILWLFTAAALLVAYLLERTRAVEDIE